MLFDNVDKMVLLFNMFTARIIDSKQGNISSIIVNDSLVPSINASYTFIFLAL